MNPASKVLVIVLCPRSSEKQKLFAKSIYLFICKYNIQIRE